MQIVNARLGSLPQATVVVEGARIVEVRPTRRGDQGLEAAGRWLLPGFIDVHVHGAMGHDTMDATPEALQEMARFYASKGVTSFLPTTLTAPAEEIRAALDNVSRYESQEGARVLGVHLEGPYLNPNFPGAQSLEDVRPAEPAEYEGWFASGQVRLITVAPEWHPANLDLVRYAVEHGAAVAVGHSGANYEQVVEAVSLGLTQATHTFNGMGGMHHRQPGTAGAVLARDEIFAQIIVDFVHLHPAMVKLAVRAKGLDKTVLISDAMRATGCPDGDYELGHYTAHVRQGVATLDDDRLAGSTLTMDRAVANVMEACGLELWQAQRMASAAPAQSLGIGDRLGEVQAGYEADLILVDDQLKVWLTIVQGRVVYSAA